MLWRGLYSQVFNSLAAAADSPQLQPFISIPGIQPAQFKLVSYLWKVIYTLLLFQHA